ncbi:MAG: polysaccharide pyruvyl transferase CsaB [Trueperaceae bacterium]
MKLLLSGYYGYGNLGDEALLSGIITGLKNYGHEITVLSGNPEYTKRLHNVNAVSRYKGLPFALLRHDAVISGGGGLLQDKSSNRSLHYYLGVLSLAKLFRKKAIVYGQSIGPLSESGKRDVVKTLRGVAVAVRDEGSQKLLVELGIRSELVADGALLLEGSVENPKLQIPFGFHIRKHASITNKQALEPEKPAPFLFFPRAGYPAITTAMTQLAKELSTQGHTVVGSSIQPNEDTRDLKAIQAAVLSFQIKEATTPDELINLVSQCSYVVSGRLHGLILAAVAGVDFAGLVYDPKVSAFLEEAGAPCFHLPIDQDALNQTVLARTPADWSKVEALRARAKVGLAWLNQQVKS